MSLKIAVRQTTVTICFGCLSQSCSDLHVKLKWEKKKSTLDLENPVAQNWRQRSGQQE